MYRSTQLDVITKQIAIAPLGVYAAKSYLEAHGTPKTIDALINHTMIGYDREDRIIQGMRAMGWQATRDVFDVRCDDQNTYWELVRAGCGVGFTQQFVANKAPEVQRILHDLPLDPLPIWLAAPEAMRSTPRVKRVWDLLENGITARFPSAKP